MESRQDGEDTVERAAQSAVPSTFGTQPWWHGPGFGDTSQLALPKNACNPPSVDLPVGDVRTKSGQPQLHDGVGNTGEVSKKVQNMGAQADGSYGKEQQLLQSVSSPPTMPEYLPPHIPTELGQSVACAAYTFSNPYYTGFMNTYGTHALVHPQLPGMPHTRTLPLEMTEDPVYVNAKQYKGIMRRRESRAKLELEKKLIKARKPYLHESRHQHALRRARGCGGRFLNKKNTDANVANPNPEDGTDSLAPHPTKSPNSSCSSDSLLSDCPGVQDSASTMLVVGRPGTRGTREPHTNATSNNGCQDPSGFEAFRPKTGERVEEGDCGILVNRPPNRAVAIK